MTGSAVDVGDAVPTTFMGRRLPLGWPLRLYLLAYPLWWLFGFTAFIPIMAAVPMAVWLYRRRDRIVVPPAFGWWAMFLVVVVLSGAMLGLTAPGTLSGSAMGRLPAYAIRLLNYAAATLALLYVVNLPEKVLSIRTIVRDQGVFYIVSVVGGLVGTFFSSLQFTSPLMYVLPRSVTHQRYVSTLLHPSVAQIQQVLGFESPRPSAPFTYTNEWGNCMSMLMVWFVIAYWIWGGPGRRLVGAAVLAVSLVPIIYSINRGLWIGLGVAFLYLCGHMVVTGRVRMVVGVAAVTCVVGMVIAVSPLYGVIQDRLAHPHSNRARESTSQDAINAARSSPILGYGSTRKVAGSAQTIAAGRSTACPQCGNAAIGGAGQMWLLLVAQGFTGAILFVGFFVRTLWVYRRDRAPVSVAGRIAIVLSLLYTLVYVETGIPLVLTMIAVGLLYRQRQLDVESGSTSLAARRRVAVRSAL
jgi:O-Antigen ligase